MTRILIVDDERQNRDLLEIMLASEGYHVVAAASGEDALAVVARQPPELILVDVMMPRMDGYQFVAAIRADDATRRIPVILITGLDDHDARTAGLNAGADGFLSRPVDRAELCECVKVQLRLAAAG